MQPELLQFLNELEELLKQIANPKERAKMTDAAIAYNCGHVLGKVHGFLEELMKHAT